MSETITVPFGDLKINYLKNRHLIDKAIRQVLESGWFVLGDAVERFEAAFAEFCEIPHAVGVGSGTEALHLALAALGVGSGDEVITVANTCVPTICGISMSGASPILVDIDPRTQTMNPERIAERLTSRTKVILPVHLYGQCADMDPILEIAAQGNLYVVEDCAQAHGALYKGRMAGTMGHLGCYSFYPSKNLGAYGDGGAVICSDEKLADRLRMLRNYGQRERYYHSMKGVNSRLDELQAAILLAKLPGLQAGNERRRTIAKAYSTAFSKLTWLDCPIEGFGRHHVYHLYVVRVAGRARFQKHMLDLGVSTMIHYPVPIHRQESYSECINQEGFLLETDSQASSIVSLPIYPEMTEDQIERVIASVKGFSAKES